MIVIQPNRYAGFSTSDFLANVDLILLIAGVGLALAVVVFSLFDGAPPDKAAGLADQGGEEMKGGNYTHRVEEPTSMDEIGQLALTFNSMADKIAADVNELREQEQLRRDMTANIAHDLVTPLTAIQGYSEAIADDVISDPDARHETAQLIGREVQRLRRLVSDMQNMTSLEVRARPPGNRAAKPARSGYGDAGGDRTGMRASGDQAAQRDRSRDAARASR